ncbi:molybdopterin dehydrogenase [Lampropedia puyangensis]|uniref:Molybdopterin dehydrogenase n=1 Tax=Lampropedia puyangensis TaxID=1330072 RepID=A0A4S8EWM6_9BURK|nr:FAD binding domain-containing protein [Lampropedia puyangensis]THT98244.1 molybdopterin dehydrogenase [Lampropedia puyangensis]
MRLLTPHTPVQAQQWANDLGPAARFISGGTVVQQEWADPRLAPLDVHFIDLMGWPQTQSIALTNAGLRIGAGARLETVRTHPIVRQHAPMLCEALAQLGAPGIRRVGTLGGNLGWGVGDTCPVLLALDAQAELANGSCEALHTLLAQPVRPLMTAFWLPRHDDLAVPRTAFEKVGHRAAFSPARIRIAMRWSTSACPVLERVAAAAPGTIAHRLFTVETLCANGHDSQHAPLNLHRIRAACLESLPVDLAAIASRLIAGHSGCLP